MAPEDYLNETVMLTGANGLDNTNADVLSRQAWDEDIYIAPDREGVGTERDNFSPEEGEGSVAAFLCKMQ